MQIILVIIIFNILPSLNFVTIYFFHTSDFMVDIIFKSSSDAELPIFAFRAGNIFSSVIIKSSLFCIQLFIYFVDALSRVDVCLIVKIVKKKIKWRYQFWLTVPLVWKTSVHNCR